MDYPKITEEQVLESLEKEIQAIAQVKDRLAYMQAMKDPVQRERMIISAKYKLQTEIILATALDTIKSFEDGLEELKANKLINADPAAMLASGSYDDAILAVENLIIRRLVSTLPDAPSKILHHLDDDEDALEVLDIVAQSPHALQFYNLDTRVDIYNKSARFLDYPESETRLKALQAVVVSCPSKGYMDILSMLSDSDRRVSLQASALLNAVFGFELYHPETLKELGYNKEGPDNYGSSEYGDLEPW